MFPTRSCQSDRQDRIPIAAARLIPERTSPQRAAAATILRAPAEGAMASCDVPPVFTDREVKLIGQSLPDTVDPRRRELLPQVLREWCRNELREHLSRESAATIRERVERMKAVADHARGLLQALEALDDRDRAAIAGQMLPRDLWLSPKGGEIIRGLTHLIREENSFLTELAAAAPAAWKQGRGAPRNIKAYLVIKDVAAIFEWLTEMEATREVGRDSAKETGPFWQFVATIWPMVFGKSKGLSNGMKTWASYRKKEGCALIANIAFRHPEWGLFKK